MESEKTDRLADGLDMETSYHLGVLVQPIVHGNGLGGADGLDVRHLTLHSGC
jgi:hypothetical protein